MPTYEYIARGGDGSLVKGKTEAASQVIAARSLREQGLIPSQIRLSVSKSGRRQAGRRGRIRLDDMVIFSRQLATMIRAGLTLTEVLNILGEQMEKRRFKEVVNQVERDVEAGASFTEALQRHPTVFSAFFTSMVRAGEAAGMLDTILDQVATYLEKAASLQRKIKGALAYPIAVMFCATAITVFLMVYVVPVFKDIFEGLEGELPFMTKITVAISEFLIGKWYFIVIALVAIGVAFRQFRKSHSGRRIVDRAFLKFPVFGPLVLKGSIAKFSRTLAVLIRAGVNILTALDIVARTSNNSIIEDAVYRTKVSIQSGETISKPLEEARVFPPMVTRMVSVGERTGNLESMLTKIADFYEDQVDATVAALTSLIEPILIIFLGFVVGFIVISMFLPLFKMIEYVS